MRTRKFWARMGLVGLTTMASTQLVLAQAPAGAGAAAAKAPTAPPAAAAPKAPAAAAGAFKPAVAGGVGKLPTPGATPHLPVNNVAGLQPLMINGRFIQPNGQLMQANMLNGGVPVNNVNVGALNFQGASAASPVNALQNPALQNGALQNPQLTTNGAGTNVAGVNANAAGTNVGTTNAGNANALGQNPNQAGANTSAQNPNAAKTLFQGSSNLNANGPTQGSVSGGRNQFLNSPTTANGSLQTHLGLSNSQVGQLNQFQSAYNQQLSELSNRFASDPQGTSGLIQSAGQQLQQNINSVLTPAQRTSLSQVTGQPNPFSGAPATSSANTPTTGNAANAAARKSSTNGAGTSAVANNLGTRSVANASANGTSTAAASSAAARNLPQANIQSGGFAAFSDPAVQQQLNLSTSQMGQLRNFQLQHVQHLGDLAGRFQTDPQGTTNLINEAASQSRQQIGSVLNPQQRQLLTSLTGQSDFFSESTIAPNATTTSTGPQ